MVINIVKKKKIYMYIYIFYFITIMRAGISTDCLFIGYTFDNCSSILSPRTGTQDYISIPLVKLNCQGRKY